MNTERVMPQDSWFSKIGNMVRRTINIANEPAKRFKILWYAFAWACALIFLVIGVGYAGAGHGAIQSKALNTVAVMERNLYVHGIIMMCVATFLIYGLNDYRKVTRWALTLYMFYSIWTALMIFIGWCFYGVSWGAPWWYIFTSVLSGTLLVLAPPLGKDGKRYAGYFEGSDRA